jgi:2-polyprenyl-3-methyl-5-hydroxy-6-metoxy-1,4-benzoquinol methylase
VADQDASWSDRFFDVWYSRVFGFPGPEQSDAEVATLGRLIREPPATILDLACGPGRHSLRLASLGYSVTGVDNSPTFLELARAEAAMTGIAVEFVEADMRSLERSADFDVVLCLSTSFGFFDDATNEDVARRIAHVLRPNGRLILQVMNRDWLVANYQTRSWQDVEEYGVVWQHRVFDPVAGVNHGTHFWRDAAAKTMRRDHTLRVYTATELDRVLSAVGLRPCEWYGDLTGQPLTHTSRWIVTVADRPPDA